MTCIIPALLLASSLLSYDSLRVNINDSTIFEGVASICSNDTLYKGTIYDNKFHVKKGFWDREFYPSHYRDIPILKGGSIDTIFYNTIDLVNGWRNNHTFLENNKVDFYYRNHIARDLNDIVFSKNYSPDTKEWVILETRKKSDTFNNYQYSTTYDRNGYFSNSEKTLTEPFIYTICFFFIAMVGTLMFFWPMHRLLPNVFKKSILLIASSGFPVLFFIVFSHYERNQIVNFLIVFLTLFWGTYLIKKTKIRYWIQLLFCSLLSSGLIIYCFVCTLEEVELSDGSYVTFSWHKGTDFIKRAYLKQVIHNLRPVPIQDKESLPYTIYLSKYEFSESDFSVITDDLFSWIDILLTKKPLGDFSYRECRLLIDRLNMITGLSFDIPTVNEWECATHGNKYIRPQSKIIAVNKGVENYYGLVHIASNAAEYSSDYYPNSKMINIDADSLTNAYEFIAICRGDNYGNHIINYVDKNSNEAFVTFRLVYRPNNVGKRHFKILGNLRLERQIGNLPKQIELVSFNGETIHQLPDYETFQERLIESRYTEKVIVALNLATKEKISFTLPKGLEYYDFSPHFYSEGIY